MVPSATVSATLRLPVLTRVGRYGVALLFLSMSAYFLSGTSADVDLWGHVRFGQDILRSGIVGQADSYSYLTAGQPWLNHEWLSECVFALLFDTVGPPALVAFKVALGMSGVLAGLALLRREGAGIPGACLLMAIATLVAFTGIVTVRPQLFTYLAFALLLAALRAADAGHHRWLLALPALFALWVNLHGGVLAGLGVLGAWTLGAVVDRVRRARVPLTWTVAAGAGSALALLANPWGWRLPWFLVRTATVPRPEITEWTPLTIGSVQGFAWLTLLAFLVVAAALNRAALRARRLLALASTVALPLVAVRHLPLFGIAAVVLGGEDLARLVGRLPPSAEGVPSRVLGAVAGLAALALAVLSLPHYRSIAVKPHYPARAVALLKASGVTGNLANHFDWGEYIIWHLSPRLKVSVDGRRETVYSEAVYAENVDFRFGLDDWRALIRNPATDLVLLSKKFPVAERMTHEGDWARVYDDPICALYARKGSTLESTLRSTPLPDVPYDGAGLVFP